MTKWWIVVAIIGLGFWVLDIKIDPLLAATGILFWASYVIARAMDSQHAEQMAKLREIEEKIDRVENYTLWKD